MAAQTQLLYLEPDDEITTVVRRLREADAPRVVLVASGRTKATTSGVALRLLAEVAGEEGREVALVADPAARALAGEAGIPAFSSVGEANADRAVPLEPAAVRRAAIHVVRGEPAPAAQPAAVPPPGQAPQPAPETSPLRGVAGDETQVVPLPAPRPSVAPTRMRAIAVRRLPRAALGALVVLLLLASAGLAAVLPAATITIEPATVLVGPVTYQIQPPVQGPVSIDITVPEAGTATGVFDELIPATGSVTFLNWNTVPVEVPAGTAVSVAGTIRFTTVERIVVPSGQFTPDGRVQAGEASVGVTAVEPGQGGNVVAGAIDTVEDRAVRTFLRGFPNNRERLVVNPAATSGGAENHLPVIQQTDVDAVVAAIMAEVARQLDERLAEHPDRLYPAVEAPAPVVDVPDGLVGSKGEATFELTGRLTYSLPYVLVGDVESAAEARLLSDTGALPAGSTVLAETIDVEPGAVTLDGEVVAVQASVRGEAAPDVNVEQLRQLVAGEAPDEVHALLDGLGDVQVDLWPGWVDHVPRLPWRIRIDLAAPSGAPGG